jgi:hypothetical protein
MISVLLLGSGTALLMKAWRISGRFLTPWKPRSSEQGAELSAFQTTDEKKNHVLVRRRDCSNELLQVRLNFQSQPEADF